MMRWKPANLWLIIGTPGIALALYWLQPVGLMPFDDEFGYFQSVLLTFQHGFPRTHDWLEPWAASLSAITALLLWVTGSFSGVVIGLKVVGGTAAFAAIFLMLRQRAYPAATAFLVSAAMITTPTMLWKWTELSTLLLYVPCLVGALLACERRQWWLFFLLWTVAFSSRQSAIVWLALPLWHAAIAAFDQGRKADTTWDRLNHGLRAAATLLAWLVVCAAIAIALLTLMNQTRSQSVITFSLLEKFQLLRFFDHAVVGFAAAMVAIGLGALALAFSQRRPLSWPLQRRRLFVAIGAAIFTVFLLTQLGRLPLSTNGWSHSRTGAVYPYVLLLLSLAGWTLTDFAVRRSYLAAASIFVVLLGFRVLLPEHHLIDIVVFGFFAAIPRPTAAARVEKPLPKIARPAVLACFAALIALHAYFGWVAKNTLDVFYGRTVLAEQAMRQGDITPVEILYAPIGYAGWKLYPYFIADDERNVRMIGGYMSYLEGAVVAVHGRLSPDETAFDIPGKVIARGIFPVGFASGVEIRLVRQNENVVWSPRSRDMARQAQIFPLNDAEWWALAKGGLKSP